MIMGKVKKKITLQGLEELKCRERKIHLKRQKNCANCIIRYLNEAVIKSLNHA